MSANAKIGRSSGRNVGASVAVAVAVFVIVILGVTVTVGDTLAVMLGSNVGLVVAVKVGVNDAGKGVRKAEASASDISGVAVSMSGIRTNVGKSWLGGDAHAPNANNAPSKTAITPFEFSKLYPPSFTAIIFT